jgi:hypothetical protein
MFGLSSIAGGWINAAAVDLLTLALLGAVIFWFRQGARAAEATAGGEHQMYVVRYVASRHDDQAVDEGVSGADTLPDAILRAKARLKYATVALPANPSTPRPIGFLIFDASGQTLLHREYVA